MTDVYNTGKGFAFVTYERKEDAEAVSIYANFVSITVLLMGFVFIGNQRNGWSQHERSTDQG